MSVTCLFQSVHAASGSPKSSIEQLAHHPQWLRLLHYGAASRKGTFLSEEFYISRQGRDDPVAELEATLAASIGVVKDETHPRCRFPARYSWLADSLDRPQWKVIPPTCNRLHQWLRENPLRSISLLMVSGYMGNPASMFGHAILKVNTANSDHDLFSAAITYGALIPPKEPVVTYIFKGLFGGYQAAYSDRYFYTQDVVYTNTEARDIWEYELNMEPDQAHFLQLHLWEVIGKKKQYFFLTRNCAYELARVIDVVMDPPLSRPAHAWYVPVEMFDRLQDLDQTSLIKPVKYHPSAERKLIYEYESLNSELRQRARQFLTQPESGLIDIILADLALAEQQRLLNFLFSYQHFVFTKESPEVSQETLSLKHELLVKRLALPPSPPLAGSPDLRPAPSEGQKPFVTAVGVMGGEHGKATALFNVTAFTQEPTGRNPLEGGELTVLDFYLNLSAEKPVVHKVNYLKIFHHALSPLPMTSPWSWRFQLRTLREVDEQYDHQIYFGVGRSKKLNKALWYGLVTPSIHSLTPFLRFRPEGGVLYPMRHDLRLNVGIGLENRSDDWQITAIGTLQYSPSRAFSLLLEYREETAPSWKLMLRKHW